MKLFRCQAATRDCSVSQRREPSPKKKGRRETLDGDGTRPRGLCQADGPIRFDTVVSAAEAQQRQTPPLCRQKVHSVPN